MEIIANYGTSLVLIAAATGAALLPVSPPKADQVDLPEIGFLVDAVVAGAPPQVIEPRAQPRRSFDERMAWAADLYARLSDQDQRSLR